MDSLTGFNNASFCPEWMQDGRGLTDYRPRADTYFSTAKVFGANDSIQFRSILTQKGVNLIDDYAKLYQYKNFCDCGDFRNVPLSSCNLK